MTKPPDDAVWESVTWEGAEQATLRDGMKMTFAQKIQWLEQMHRLVEFGGRKKRVREEPPEYGSDSKTGK